MQGVVYVELLGGGGLTPGSLVPQSPHFGGLPLFFVCWYWSFPPGVFTMRTLLERVLYLIANASVVGFQCVRRQRQDCSWGLTDFSVAVD